MTRLPKAEIGERLGTAGVALWERAAGETARVLRLVEPVRTFVAEWTYDPPVESIEPLLFRLRRFAERVAFELRAAGLVASALALTLQLEDETDERREFRLPEPGADVDGWLRLLQGHLAGVRTAARVVGVRLGATPCRPPEKQDGLFETGLRDPVLFWETLARLGAVVGDDRVGTPVRTDTHRPDAFVLEKPAEAVPGPAAAPVHPPLRAGAAPVPAGVAGGVERAAARPVRVECDEFSDTVAACHGPWLGLGRLVAAVGLGGGDLAGRAGRRRRLPARAHRGGLADRGDLRLMAYVELHARSAFSFLRGSALPETLAAEAGRRQLPALALCDRDGVYGAVRLFMSGREAGVRALVGCELTMEDGSVVPVLVASQAGYRRLCGLLTTAHLRAPKGEGRVAWSELAEDSAGLIALTGDEEGPVRRAWREQGAGAAAAVGARLTRIFGRDRLFAELQRHFLPEEDEENNFLVDWARASGLPLLATNGVIQATPAERGVADVFTCLREHTTLDAAGCRLARNGERYLKDGAAMAALFADLPEAIANTARLAERLEFTLANLGYRFPDFPVPAGETQESHLRARTYLGARERYGRVEGAVRRQLDHELALIGETGLPADIS